MHSLLNFRTDQRIEELILKPLCVFQGGCQFVDPMEIIISDEQLLNEVQKITSPKKV